MLNIKKQTLTTYFYDYDFNVDTLDCFKSEFEPNSKELITELERQFNKGKVFFTKKLKNKVYKDSGFVCDVVYFCGENAFSRFDHILLSQHIIDMLADKTGVNFITVKSENNNFSLYPFEFAREIIGEFYRDDQNMNFFSKNMIWKQELVEKIYREENHNIIQFNRG